MFIEMSGFTIYKLYLLLVLQKHGFISINLLYNCKMQKLEKMSSLN